MAEAKPKLLIVEDDLDLADMLTAYFRIEGYEVVTAYRGEEAIRAYQTSHPALVILDMHLPDIDGDEVANRLRGNRRTAYIPLIFMTDKRERIDRLQGLELGVDGYITKPFDIQELRLRVRNMLRRASQDTLTNPVTGLPEGTLVDEHLDECLIKPEWTMLTVSLENLDAFRDIYGFGATDDVLRAVSVMLHNAIRENGSAEDFFGHLDPVNFVLITGQERAANLQERIRSRLEPSLEFFYPIKDRKKSARQSKRLAFKIDVLQSTEGPFTSLEVLKGSLMRKK
jgi:PleD family two-component response regulator